MAKSLYIPAQKHVFGRSTTYSKLKQSEIEKEKRRLRFHGNIKNCEIPYFSNINLTCHTVDVINLKQKKTTNKRAAINWAFSFNVLNCIQYWYSHVLDYTQSTERRFKCFLFAAIIFFKTIIHNSFEQTEYVRSTLKFHRMFRI